MAAASVGGTRGAIFKQDCPPHVPISKLVTSSEAEFPENPVAETESCMVKNALGPLSDTATVALLPLPRLVVVELVGLYMVHAYVTVAPFAPGSTAVHV